MKSTYHHDGRTAVIELKGSLTASLTDSLNREFSDWLQANPDVTKLVLNLAKVDMIDSSSMAVFISVLKKMTRKNGDMVVAELTSTVRMLFEISRLQSVFEIFDTVEAALQDSP